MIFERCIHWQTDPFHAVRYFYVEPTSSRNYMRHNAAVAARRVFLLQCRQLRKTPRRGIRRSTSKSRSLSPSVRNRALSSQRKYPFSGGVADFADIAPWMLRCSTGIPPKFNSRFSARQQNRAAQAASQVVHPLACRNSLSSEIPDPRSDGG